ncbi:unnamed protein product [Effrenium voratum]|uniref:IPT/TIG domain-containing protein n=1 Tax=Effrenium voratum TaxID=2562239 RepID=A0AA36INR9_9DINO|nr:unnamed protein product [Effrenium voratum]
MARYTPFVSSIDPVEGPYGGGTTVMLSGSGFLCNGTATMEELSVMLAGSPCDAWTKPAEPKHGTWMEPCEVYHP